MAGKIEDYGFISNLNTGALVSRTGSIDWLCAPRFDSDACLSALIGYDEHGHWALRPTSPVRESRQRYRGDSLILETEFVCDSGRARVIDFMPLGGESCQVLRIVEGLSGTVQLEMMLAIRFGYGAEQPWIRFKPGQSGDHGCSFVAGPSALRLHTPARIAEHAGNVTALFQVKQGERVPFQLNWFASHLGCPAPLNALEVLAQTEALWREWSGRCAYRGAYRDAVMRSLITLKGLTYAPTGGILAALTTSLPESIGGGRNWDYRFCWLRDASLTLDALMIGGYVDEARGFREWLRRAIAGSPDDIQGMYDITGGRRLTEFELGWLPGYEGSHPVRAGNAAAGQFQLDVYGEVLSCLYAGRSLGLPQDQDSWVPLASLLDFVERAWQWPDDGIWEVRGGRRHFTHSKIMAWVAIDRAIKAIGHFGTLGARGLELRPHLRALRERIHTEVCQRGFNTSVGAFTQSYGSEALDASVLVIPHVGFLPASDPRVLSTVAAIEKHLVRDGFVLRYSTEHTADGLPGDEGAFLACSFWLADNYAFAGRLDDATRLFERLLAVRNHLGLLAEEYEPRLRRQIGNFPQAFSHLALISTARIIDSKRAKQAAKTPVRAASSIHLH